MAAVARNLLLLIIILRPSLTKTFKFMYESPEIFFTIFFLSYILRVLTMSFLCRLLTPSEFLKINREYQGLPCLLFIAAYERILI